MGGRRRLHSGPSFALLASFSRHSCGHHCMLASAMNQSTSARHCILVVDDEPHLVRAVRMYLELQGYAVFSAASGEDALDAIRDRLPDLVILDAMLPGLDGF